MLSNTSNKQTFRNLGKVILGRHKGMEHIFAEINFRDLRASLILFLSILLFVLIWVPWCIAYVFFKYYPEKMSLALLLSIYMMFQLNSMINPFLYVRSIGDADVILSRWIKRLFCQTTETSTSHSVVSLTKFPWCIWFLITIWTICEQHILSE